MSELTSQFVIHIGQKKCGSTALQRFLSANSEMLQLLGYDYPTPIDKTISHHILARWLLDQWRPLPTGPRYAAVPHGNTSYAESESPPIEILRSQVNHSKKTSVISSEWLYNIDPLFLAERFSPENTKIIVYLREQLDFLHSRYAWAVLTRKMHQSFAEFLDTFQMSMDYAAFMDNWANAFGRHNVTPRIYDRNLLRDGDIRADFMGLLGVTELNTFSFPGLVKSNPSIGGSLLKFKLILNLASDWDEGKLRRRTHVALRALAAQDERFRAPMPITAELARTIRGKYEASNKALFEKYFPHLEGFNMKTFCDGQGENALTIEDFEYICAFLKEFPSKDPGYHNDNVIDAHYTNMKKLLD